MASVSACSLSRLVDRPRTKRWMHTAEFDNTLLFYPREVALRLLPLGFPAGEDLPTVSAQL